MRFNVDFTLYWTGRPERNYIDREGANGLAHGAIYNSKTIRRGGAHGSIGYETCAARHYLGARDYEVEREVWKSPVLKEFGGTKSIGTDRQVRSAKRKAL